MVYICFKGNDLTTKRIKNEKIADLMWLKPKKKGIYDTKLKWIQSWDVPAVWVTYNDSGLNRVGNTKPKEVIKVDKNKLANGVLVNK